jgi:predicted phage terminase large subunit-like protein
VTTLSPLSPQAAAAELLRRRKARASLLGYVNAIDVPGKPASEDPDEWMFKPIETSVAAHHILLLDRLEKVAKGEIKRLMIFMPPGSAKSTYASVVFPTWFMGKNPGSKIILASYATDIARKQGRRARQIVRSARFAPIFSTVISADTSAADEWSLNNGSEFMAGGILSGVTGNRAHGIIVDDPVAGREEADSETIRKKTKQAYEDDLRTRLIPGGWEIIIQTRWHEDDLSGSILPTTWAGESGDILCRDGNVWHVICLPAIAERADDPLGRKIGEPLWPEWFTPEHFATFKAQPRTWSALFQQRPTAESGDLFKREWIKPHAKVPDKRELRLFGASDYAVTSNGGDYTVHGVGGVDHNGDPWLLDLWREQTTPDKWVEQWCDMVLTWHPVAWAEETGQIKGAVGPFRMRVAMERGAYCVLEAFPTKGDKAIRSSSIRGRMAMRGLKVPADAPWLPALLHELLAFPAGKHDDQVDMLGLLGQLLDKMDAANPPKDEPKTPPRGIEQASLNEIASLAPAVDDYL